MFYLFCRCCCQILSGPRDVSDGISYCCGARRSSVHFVNVSKNKCADEIKIFRAVFPVGVPIKYVNFVFARPSPYLFGIMIQLYFMFLYIRNIVQCIS